MFLCDIAEFSRKVKVKNLPINALGNSRSYTAGRGIVKNSLQGDYHYRGNNSSSWERRRLKSSPNDGIDSPAVMSKTKQTGNTVVLGKNGKKREIKRNPNKKPIRKPKLTTVNQPTGAVKNKSKFLNKYTLGAAGLVGVAATGYGGYKLLTRNKKGDRK